MLILNRCTSCRKKPHCCHFQNSTAAFLILPKKLCRIWRPFLSIIQADGTEKLKVFAVINSCCMLWLTGHSQRNKTITVFFSHQLLKAKTFRRISILLLQHHHTKQQQWRICAEENLTEPTFSGFLSRFRLRSFPSPGVAFSFCRPRTGSRKQHMWV